MDLYRRIEPHAFAVLVSICAIPGLGVILVLASWLFPELGFLFSYGRLIFIVGWLIWAFLLPAFSPSPEKYWNQVYLSLFFFPVMYPFVVILLPWSYSLTRLNSNFKESKSAGDPPIK